MKSGDRFAPLKGFLRRWGLIDRSPIKGFLRGARGVIHVGAHTGQERCRYAQYRLNVLWIEPIPELFEALQRNLVGWPRQHAVRSLITDRDAAEYKFHITSNVGGSSSIFPLALHRDIWPDVTEAATIRLVSKTLPTLLREHQLDIADYDILIMDTQGSELLVLKGAESILDRFKFVQAEVADFQAYEGGCQLAEVEVLMRHHGFFEHARKTIAVHPAGGAYYDVVYKRR